MENLVRGPPIVHAITHVRGPKAFLETHHCKTSFNTGQGSHTYHGSRRNNTIPTGNCEVKTIQYDKMSEKRVPQVASKKRGITNSSRRVVA